MEEIVDTDTESSWKKTEYSTSIQSMNPWTHPVKHNKSINGGAAGAALYTAIEFQWLGKY